MVPCPICQHPNPAGATVCQSCGSPLGASTSATTPSLALPKGTTLLNGRYVIEGDLGQGGFGITYKATDTLLSRPVAIKEFFPSSLGCARRGKSVVPNNPQDYQTSLQEFLDEARILAKIKHPNKVEVYDVFEENNTAYMVMEFIEGKNLLDLLNDRGGVMDEKEAIGYIIQVARALEAVHQAGYLHRDIKPENIIVTRDGRAVLVDFGAARQFIAQRTKTMDAVLTPGYAPLEQYSSRARFGPPLDIYALGATLYHLLTGKIPPSAPDRAQGVNLVPPHQLNPKVSRQVSEAIMKAMEMNVNQRPQSVREFINLLTGTSVGAPAVPKAQTSVAPQAPTSPTQKVTWQEIGTFGWHGGSVRSITFSPDGRFLASGGEDNKVSVRETGNWREEAILEHGWHVLSVAFSPDGRFLASGCRNGKVTVWLVGNWLDFATFPHRGSVRSVSFSPNGSLLASGCQDGTVNIWDLGSRRRIACLKHGTWVNSLAFSPDGMFLASGGYDGQNSTIKIWDLGSLTDRVTLPYWGQVVLSIAFSPDGKFLASGSGVIHTTMWGTQQWGGAEVKVWEVGSWREVVTLRRDKSGVSVAFSPDGRFLAAGGIDGTVRVWEVGSWREVATFSGRSWSLVSFSPDGKFLASGNDDGTIKLWEIVGALQVPVKKPTTRQPQAILQPTPKPVYRRTKGQGQGTIVGAKDPTVAGLLSFFIPGTGQIYNGQIAKGCLILCLSYLSYFLAAIHQEDILILPFGIIWIINLIDAVRIAQKLQRGQSVGKWEWF
jgi:serine/threonine protein kinase/TM2 domain-containing membrane protein YozV